MFILEIFRAHNSIKHIIILYEYKHRKNVYRFFMVKNKMKSLCFFPKKLNINIG